MTHGFNKKSLQILDLGKSGSCRWRIGVQSKVMNVVMVLNDDNGVMRR